MSTKLILIILFGFILFLYIHHAHAIDKHVDAIICNEDAIITLVTHRITETGMIEIKNYEVIDDNGFAILCKQDNIDA